MGEVAIKVACPKCDADIRPGSVFCYNCGSKVAETRTGFQADVKTNAEPAADKATKPVPGLRSAAALRRRQAAFKREPDRFIWEPVREGSNTQFVFVTFLLFIFSLILTALAFYLR